MRASARGGQARGGQARGGQATLRCGVGRTVRCGDAQALTDALEGITHSLCTLEFENHRDLYDWVVRECAVPCTPRLWGGQGEQLTPSMNRIGCGQTQ